MWGGLGGYVIGVALVVRNVSNKVTNEQIVAEILDFPSLKYKNWTRFLRDISKINSNLQLLHSVELKVIQKCNKFLEICTSIK